MDTSAIFKVGLRLFLLGLLYLLVRNSSSYLVIAIVGLFVLILGAYLTKRELDEERVAEAEYRAHRANTKPRDLGRFDPPSDG